MRIKYEIGNAVTVDCHVILEDMEVTEVMWFGLNILPVLEVETLDKIAEAAAQKFRDEMSEP